MWLAPYAKQEVVVILGAGLIGAVAAMVVGLWWLALVVAISAGLLLAFFRDPPRHVSLDRCAVVAPADGRVTEIVDVEQAPFLNAPAARIGIFLSVFDVHINRAPFPAKVASVEYVPGRFLDARRAEASELNESNTLGLVLPRNDRPVMAVRQISGKLARRIVCTARQGDVLHRGQRIGMIKLGSRTELYIASELRPEWQVKVGQHVSAGSTVLCRVSLNGTTKGEGAGDKG